MDGATIYTAREGENARNIWARANTTRSYFLVEDKTQGGRTPLFHLHRHNDAVVEVRMDDGSWAPFDRPRRTSEDLTGPRFKGTPIPPPVLRHDVVGAAVRFAQRMLQAWLDNDDSLDHGKGLTYNGFVEGDGNFGNQLTDLGKSLLSEEEPARLPDMLCSDIERIAWVLSRCKCMEARVSPLDPEVCILAVLPDGNQVGLPVNCFAPIDKEERRIIDEAYARSITPEVEDDEVPSTSLLTPDKAIEKTDQFKSVVPPDDPASELLKGMGHNPLDQKPLPVELSEDQLSVFEKLCQRTPGFADSIYDTDEWRDAHDLPRKTL